MFRKVIVFGLFEMIKKKEKKRVRTTSPGLGSASGLGTVARAIPFLVLSEPKFRRFYKMIFEIVYDIHCICI